MFDFRTTVAERGLVRCTKKSLTWDKAVPTIGFVRCSNRELGNSKETRKLRPRAVRSDVPGRSSTPEIQAQA